MKIYDLKRDITSYRTMIIILALLCTLIIALSIRSVCHARSYNSDVNYISVQINEGDTLTEIASYYLNTTNLNHTEYVKEICRINKISSDDIIKTGAYLIIPVSKI